MSGNEIPVQIDQICLRIIGNIVTTVRNPIFTGIENCLLIYLLFISLRRL